jgi:hypothetical protein
MSDIQDSTFQLPLLEASTVSPATPLPAAAPKPVSTALDLEAADADLLPTHRDTHKTETRVTTIYLHQADPWNGTEPIGSAEVDQYFSTSPPTELGVIAGRAEDDKWSGWFSQKGERVFEAARGDKDGKGDKGEAAGENDLPEHKVEPGEQAKKEVEWIVSHHGMVASGGWD